MKYNFNINITNDIEFKEKYGFIFVFQIKTITSKQQTISSEIKPLGIIYTQTNDYYFAPLTKDYDIQKIVEKYVKKVIT